MLKDTARTDAYEQAIKQNKSDFEGKVVLDGKKSGVEEWILGVRWVEKWNKVKKW